MQASDQYDLAAWEFTEPARAGKLDQSKFIPLLESEYLHDGDNVIGCFVYGYRFGDLEIDWLEDPEFGPKISHVHMAQKEIYCEYHGDAFEGSVARLVASGHDVSDLNGMSGGPAFIFVENNQIFSCKFAGIVTRGGNGNIYLVKHTAVRRLIDRAIAVDP